VGFAATRDFVSWLRTQAKDDAGVANPLGANAITAAYTYVVSQPGRFLNDFRWLGFNEDESGKKVFDAMMQWISAGDGINMNLRFSQPGRTERNRQDQLYDEGHFPFAHASMKDAITGKTDGRYNKCTATNTCPLGMEVYSANEYWVKGASLLHTTPDGKTDLPDHPQARIYFISSHQHGVGNGTSKGLCQQLGNPLNVFPTMRALWIAMDAWATTGTPPPASQHPTLADKTMVAPLPQSGVGFPSIPGVQYTGLKTTRYLWNYGPRFQQGIMDINPPVYSQPFFDNPANGAIYPTFVPTTDKDGNDVAGLRLLDVVVPLATYTGWSLRSTANDGPDGCEGSGQMIPFAKTAADRGTDPRLSVAERYGSFSGYYWARLFAVNRQLDQGYLLTDDAFTEFTRGLTSAQHDYGLKDESGDE
ncbi:MAG TPA: alpha/beta hydrolase domain-containing protein, partial [Usitatibacter sp.]